MKIPSKTVSKTIHEILQILKMGYQPQKVVLFGSAVHGRITEDSDIDMLIIKETGESSKERWMTVGRLVRDLKRSIPFEPIILTPRELEDAAESGDLFIKEIISTGKILYDKAA